MLLKSIGNSFYITLFFLFASCSTTSARDYNSRIRSINSQIAELSSVKANTVKVNSLELERINLAVFKGEFKQAQDWIWQAKIQAGNDTLQQALILIAEGELYFRISDVGFAQKKWDTSFALIKNIREVDSIYIAYTISKQARVASFNMEIDKANKLSTQAMEIVKRNLKSVTKINTGEIAREYAFNNKIYANNYQNRKNFPAIRLHFMEAMKYADLSLGKGNYYEAQILHDVGNTFTDEAELYSYKQMPFAQVKPYMDSANMFYNQSIRLNRLFFGTCDRIAVTYFVQGLLLNYCSPIDSLFQSLDFYNKSIHELVPSFSPRNPFDNPKATELCYDKAKVIETINFKGRQLQNAAKIKHDTSLIEPAYHQFKDGVSWYMMLLNDYHSNQVSIIAATYASVPYDFLPSATFDLYLKSHNPKYIPELFTYLELKNYFTLLTSALNKKHLSQHDIESAILPLDSIQKGLDGNTAILEYVDEERVAIITRSKIEFAPSRFVNVHELRSAIANSNFKEYKQLAYKIYVEGFQPTTQYLQGVTKLVIIPSGDNILCPFEALLTDTTNCISFSDCKSKYLINRYTFEYAFSSTLWMKGKTKNQQPSLNLFAPGYTKNATLKFNDDLAIDLAKEFDGKCFGNCVATKSQFISLASGSNDILHLALHGYANLESPELSKLTFYGEDDTSALGLADIEKLQIHSPLVVLAACKTHEGKRYGGEGLLNFSRSFALAGARAIISTLWSVDDRATSIILGSFYKYLDDGQDKAQALHQAKLDYLKKCSKDESSPLYWSGIILNGDDSALHIKKRNRYSLGIFLGLGLSLVIGISYYRRMVTKAS